MSPDVGVQPSLPREIEASRKRAAVELFVRHEATLRRTASRYSLCADDVDEALQRGLEILLTKAPSEDPRELIRWTQTVVKHEALAVRRDRERILSGPAARVREDGEDWVALLPAHEAGPAERVERREAIARSREALQALKPQELRALGLLAEGYSYAEIGEITGFSQTKVNRCLAEGRERFRRLLAASEDGSRCSELSALLSAYCDGEASPAEAASVREHLRACPHCRATMRTYRAAPGAVAALLPAMPFGRSLLDRAHQALADTAARLGGGAGDATASQVAIAGGTRGAGTAALAKVLAICAGTAGGAVACVAGGVVPAPLHLDQTQKAPAIERQLDRHLLADWSGEAEPVVGPDDEPAPEATVDPAPAVEQPASEPAPEPEVTEATPAPVAEAAPEPAPVLAPPVSSPPATTSAAPSGSAAGEFGP
ncbi:MAG: sigma-70 family RNA polymerase sigma factor [Solirubrobacterales bacterium]